MIHINVISGGYVIAFSLFSSTIDSTKLCGTINVGYFHNHSRVYRIGADLHLLVFDQETGKAPKTPLVAVNHGYRGFSGPEWGTVIYYLPLVSGWYDQRGYAAWHAVWYYSHLRYDKNLQTLIIRFYV